LNSGQLFLPASRSGLQLLYRHYFARESGGSLTVPIKDFLRFLQLYSQDNQLDESRTALLEFGEEHLLQGKVIQNGDETFYVEAQGEKAVPLYIASSMIHALTPFVKALSAARQIDWLYCDEVENSLHPLLQGEMARWLIRMANAGVHVIISSHSDTMASRFNNLFMLSRRDRRNADYKMLSELELMDADLLRPDVKAAPYFDFYNYSGLHRSVKLVICPEEYIFDYSTAYKLENGDAKVHYQVETAGDGSVEVELLDEEGACAAKAQGNEGVLAVKNARLWQVRDAYLYTIRIRLYRDGELADEYEDQIGIRTVEIRGTKFLVNGSPVYLKGFGRHEDSDIAGRGFNICMMKRDFELMKWIGANSFRTSHYPYDEEVYRMADREGFLILDEVAAVGLFKSTKNFVDVTNGKVTCFFSMDTIPGLLKRHLRDIEELIARDKNHPSVVAWSLLNEPETTTEDSVPYFKQVFDHALALDPQKRPRTFAEIKNSGPYICKCHQFSDFICLNRYYGWYIKGGYEISDAFEDFREEMRQWKEVEPDKPFMFTEYGSDTSAMEHKLPSVMWSQEYQEEVLEQIHDVFDSLDFVVGEQVWNFADFQTTEGIMRVNGNKKGIFTRQRQPKTAAFLLKKRWESLPLDYKGED